MDAVKPVATVLYLVTEDWYFWSHRLAIARAARDRGYRVVVATRVRDHGERIRAEGFELRALGRLRRRSARPWNEFLALIELVRLYRELRPDLVHHVALKPVVYGSLAARLAGVGVVINAIAGLGFVFASRTVVARVLRPLVRVAYRSAFAPSTTRIIVQNADDLAAVEALGVPRTRIALIPGSGVDLDRFHPTPEPPGPVVVSMVSRMLRDKGVEELATAARRLADTAPGVCVRLVGPPDPENPASLDETELDALVANAPLTWCPGTEDVPAVWASSHVAVLPSYREGLPKSLLEAAASGRAMVATDVPGCRDVVIAGKTGLLVPPRDAMALADAIAALAGDGALRRRLGVAARQHVAAFSEAAVVARTLDLYDVARADTAR